MNALSPMQADRAAVAQTIFDTVRDLSPDGAGVSRPAFSSVETSVLDYLAEVATAHGLDVTVDAGRNYVFSLPRDRDADRWALIGSHVDSVPEGGNFDGLAGVVAGMLVLIDAQQSGRILRMPVKCIAMRAEESAWFGACYLASRALTGTLRQAELTATHRGDGRPMSAHMADLGIDVTRVAAGDPLCDLSRIIEYLELHIEQGPLLAEQGIAAAVVTGIRGNIRFRDVRCVGEPGHSGAVPRGHRHDAVLGFADLMTRLDQVWAEIVAEGGDLVLTSGMVATDPARHAMARIAEEIEFSLDIRSQEVATIDRVRGVLLNATAEIATRRGVRFELGKEIPAAPALMDARIVRDLLAAMETPFVMSSGAGHDAAIFAQAGIPTGMIFVRNRYGSHNPAEAMEIDDLLAGTRVLSKYLEP